MVNIWFVCEDKLLTHFDWLLFMIYDIILIRRVYRLIINFQWGVFSVSINFLGPQKLCVIKQVITLYLICNIQCILHPLSMFTVFICIQQVTFFNMPSCDMLCNLPYVKNVSKTDFFFFMTFSHNMDLFESELG